MVLLARDGAPSGLECQCAQSDNGSQNFQSKKSELSVPGRGWRQNKKEKKQKDLLVTNPKKTPARVGWPKRLALVRATLWADFAVITAQL